MVSSPPTHAPRRDKSSWAQLPTDNVLLSSTTKGPKSSTQSSTTLDLGQLSHSPQLINRIPNIHSIFLYVHSNSIHRSWQMGDKKHLIGQKQWEFQLFEYSSRKFLTCFKENDFVLQWTVKYTAWNSC